MTDSQQRAKSEIGAKDDISVRLGANVVHLPIVRAVAVTIAVRADFDAICDLELAVDEACSSLITHAVADSVLACRFTIGPDPDGITFAVTVTSAEGVTPSESAVGWAGADHADRWRRRRN